MPSAKPQGHMFNMAVFADKMAELVCGAYVVKKRNTKSAVWQHLGLRATKEGVIVDKEQNKPAR